jgi:hypothetical protein
MNDHKIVKNGFKLVQTCFLKLTTGFLYLLKDMPAPDFNHEYDSTML